MLIEIKNGDIINAEFVAGVRVVNTFEEQQGCVVISEYGVIVDRLNASSIWAAEKLSKDEAERTKYELMEQINKATK